MREAVRVVIGIDARIVGGELFHFVEAMFDRVEFGLIAQMPLAREIGRIAVLLEELGDRRRGLRQAVLVARHNHHRQRRADRDASGHERGAARGATRLAVPTGEDGAFRGDAIDVRGRMAEVRAPTIGPEIVPSGVVGHQHDDVRPLPLRPRAAGCQNAGRRKTPRAPFPVRIAPAHEAATADAGVRASLALIFFLASFVSHVLLHLFLL